MGTISQTELNDVARLMNQRPRKTLGWKTPEEAMAEELAAFRSNVALETSNQGVGWDTLNKLIKKGYVTAGRHDPKRDIYGITYLSAKPQNQIGLGILEIIEFDEVRNRVSVEYKEDRERQVKSVWHRSEHDAGAYGSDMLRTILGSNAFTFPKSLYAVRDAIVSVSRDNLNALVVDFFAGSGTTLNAVSLLNSLDGVSRRCILVTNNEVSPEDAQQLTANGHLPGDPVWEEKGICKSVTWARLKFTTLGSRNDGTELPGEYLTGALSNAISGGPSDTRHSSRLRTS